MIFSFLPLAQSSERCVDLGSEEVLMNGCYN
jgi:hypothetical protein